MVESPISATFTLPTASVATPNGRLKLAAAPTPSVLPPAPADPANVLTTPAGVILRMVLLYVSDTYTLPALSVATPDGNLKLAAVPVPSALPATPADPASVLTAPAGVITRIVWLYVSATYTLPAPSIAAPHGVLKRAAAPLPSALPVNPADPASVLT